MSLARAIISGTVLSEPEKRFTPNNFAVANFTIQATQTGGRNNEPSFLLRVTCWRNLADKVAESVHKGDDVVVEGRLQINQYETQGGITRRMYEIDASNVYIGQLHPLAPAFEPQINGNSKPQQVSAAPGQSQAMQQPFATVSPSNPPGETVLKGEFLTVNDIPF